MVAVPAEEPPNRTTWVWPPTRLAATACTPLPKAENSPRFVVTATVLPSGGELLFDARRTVIVIVVDWLPVPI